jgi:hypothetical protein
MSTMPMIFNVGELRPPVYRIQRETERVVAYSRAEAPRIKDVLRIVQGIVRIKLMFRDAVSNQSKLLMRLTSFDFTTIGPNDIQGLASEIEGMVATGRYILSETDKLGSEIRIWWRPHLTAFAEQIEHFDSISESLRMECDSEATLLLAVAASGVGPKRPQRTARQSAWRGALLISRTQISQRQRTKILI